MESIVKTRGKVQDGRILPFELPFSEGEEVEMVVWLSNASQPMPEKTVEQRLREFDEWVNMPREYMRGVPPLSDEAMSRESIYEDRGL